MATATYPAIEFFKAVNALKLSLDISEVDSLYVDFESVRSDASFKNLLKHLGIFHNKVNEEAANAKILYTGHTGCGKSTELLKLHHKLNSPDLYFSVYLDVEDYLNVTDFKSEDLLVILVSALVAELERKKINYAVPGLEKIARDWMSDTELQDEVKSRMETEAGVAAELTTGGLLKIFSARAFVKSLFSYGSQTSKVVRRKTLERQGDYITDLNLALRDIRNDIRRTGKGREILFIIDGLEKLRWNRYDMYKKTFVQNTTLVNDLNCSIIFCVPIDTFYDREISQVLTTCENFTLPLIAINEKTSSLFGEIITRRIDPTVFFEPGVLGYCVQQSGGSPRQLLRIVEQALFACDPDQPRISMQVAEKTCYKLGQDLHRRLQTKHIEKLRSGDYEHADDDILDLLFSLCLMEYNGDQNNRQPNPLLTPFLGKSRSDG